MTPFRKISIVIWEGDFADATRGDPEAHGIASYLMTNRHNTMGLGLYRCPIDYIDEAVGYGFETCLERVRKLSETGFLRYDDARKGAPGASSRDSGHEGLPRAVADRRAGRQGQLRS